jgi:hypothetical protein
MQCAFKVKIQKYLKIITTKKIVAKMLRKQKNKTKMVIHDAPN